MLAKNLDKHYPGDTGRFRPTPVKDPLTRKELRRLRRLIREVANASAN